MSSVAVGPELVRGLQERAARALPAVRVEDAGGWWLREAPGGPWWIGSVLPHGDATGPELERRVAAAEAFFASRGETARFQISPGACPAGLEALLEARGYRAESPMSLQVAEAERVAELRPSLPLELAVDERPDREWFDVWMAISGHDADPQAEWDLLDRIDRPCGYVRAMLGDAIVAVGRVVAESGWAGVFGLGTLPVARGRGAGSAVLASMAEWGRKLGADRMYLQVERENAPALRLYGRAGFEEVCAYHYRAAA